MAPSKTQKIIKDTSGNEVVMIRIDKTLKEIIDEKPSSRWDVDYWHPKYDKVLLEIHNHKVIPLSNFIKQTVSGFRGKTEYLDKGGIQSIEAVSILANGVGIDPLLSRQVKKGGRFDAPSRRTKLHDLLFVRSGVGTSGRSVLVTKSSENMIIGGHILRVVLNGEIEPGYIQVYLKTHFGWEMLDRVRVGVGAMVLDESDVCALPIPILSDSIRKHISKKFLEMTIIFDKAIEFKKSSNQAEYKKNLAKAEKMLKDLIARTEAVIRGEREDVI